MPGAPVATQVAVTRKSAGLVDRRTSYKSVVAPGADGADHDSVKASVN